MVSTTKLYGINMNLCPNCYIETKYNTKYDCFYCESCNIWTESKCRNDECEFCAKRPEKPIKEKE